MSKKSILIILCSVLSVMVTQISEAAVIHVTTTHDNVPGSLRAAITKANTNGEDNTIYLPAGTYMLSGDAREDANVSGDLDIDTNRKLSIKGVGVTKTIIDGKGLDRVLHILNGTVTITDLTIRKGKAPDGRFAEKGGDGGGIYNNGNLTLTRCVIKENEGGHGGYFHGSYGYDGGDGGGIYNAVMLTLNNCTITGNSAGEGSTGDDSESYGGDGGGICNDGNLIMSGCTVNGNVSGNAGDEGAGSGSGISNHTEAYLTMTNCTISGNQIGKRFIYFNGGGLYNDGDSLLIGVTVVNNIAGGIYNYGAIRLINSIVANNWWECEEECGEALDCYGTFDWVCYSLIADTTDCILTGFQKANILGQDPLLGPLADNGGPTKTHALLPGSPAIDAGNRSGLFTDQRGYKRPINIPGIPNVSDGADIGAYEYILPHSTADSH